MSQPLPDDLPKQYDHQAAQQQWYGFWEEQGYFHNEPDDDREPYTIVIPPPNVTGALHLGHALNNTLQDVLIRLKRMQGYNTLWMPGTDHAGIATQAVVERRLLAEEKLSRHDLGREELVRRIWKWKDQYETRILGQLKQMGCSCDWQRTRFTLDDVCAKAVRQTFFNFFQDSLIYRGKRLVNWDTFLQTAVSDDEVFHESVDGHFWHFHYPVIDPQPGEPDRVTIATTRPETMLGDTAVAVHPDPRQALQSVEDDLEARLASAPAKEKDFLDQQLSEVRRRREAMLPHLEQLREMAAAGRKLMLPLLDRPIPLVADVWAKPELGSGCVKITPAHDANDYEVWQRNPDIGAVNILHPDGTLNKHAGPYAGLTVKAARKQVVADMKAAGLLSEIEDRPIDLAHSDRSKTPIEPYLADQWFVKMDQLAENAIRAVKDERVKIVPPRYAKSYIDWLSEKRDWCISRNLWWGHRIPVWSKSFKSQQECESSRDKIARLAGESATALPSTQIQKDDDKDQWQLHVCLATDDPRQIESLAADGFAQSDDVLDTWFSSALWPHSTLGWPEVSPQLDFYYPTSVLVTSRDIITLWVARMVITGLYNIGDIPFHDVYIHPKILDGYGEGMSKSKGNGVDPLDVMEKFGADALRFALTYLTTETQDVRMPVEFECPHCGAHLGQTKKNRMLATIECAKCDKPFGTQWAERPDDAALPRAMVVSERFELGRNFCNKLWNASRFALLNLEGYTPGPVAPDQLAVEDRWIQSRLASVTASVTTALEEYKYAEAARTLYDFAWDEFCSFYVEMLKPRLQGADSRAVAQRVLAGVLDHLLRLLHPIIPFLTEDVWQRLGRVAPNRGLAAPQEAPPSVMIAPWPQADAQWQDAAVECCFAQFQSVLGGLREVRSRHNLLPKAAIAFTVRCDQPTADLLAPMRPYFQTMAAADGTAWGPAVEPPAGGTRVSLPGIEIFVDLKGLIDVEGEIAKKQRELDKLQGQIAGKEKKLANEKFVARAPAAVVEGERSSLDELLEKRRSLQQGLVELKSLI